MTAKNTTSIDTISHIPRAPGVYFLKNKKDEVIYIGKARNLHSRISQHKQNKNAFKNVETIHSVEWIQMANEIEALIKEREYIQHYQPKLNVLLRDDKQYSFVGITEEALPRVFLTHQPLKTAKRRGALKHIYIGPFTDASSLKHTLRWLRKIFPYYTATPKQASKPRKHPGLPCPYCHLELCPGPQPDSAAYRQSISTLKRILTGQYSFVMRDLQQNIKRAIKQQRFEDAGALQKKYEGMHNVFTHHTQMTSSPVVRRQNTPNTTADYLANLVQSDLPIYTIEGYDISNIQGTNPVASIVRFENNKPKKSLYRFMNIQQTNDEPNDFLSLQEALKRRFKHTEWSYPDLILLDGGQGQLNAGVRVLTDLHITTPIVALAKKLEELYLPGHDSPILLSSMPEDVALLLQYVRNEAHRFAITRHRARHRKQFRA